MTDLLAHLDETRLYGFVFGAHDEIGERLIALRQALRHSNQVGFSYVDANEQSSIRTVCPLGLSFMGHAWLLTGWCELRDSFRNFRVDRMVALEELAEGFVPEPGKRFEDYLKPMEAGTPPRTSS